MERCCGSRSKRPRSLTKNNNAWVFAGNSRHALTAPTRDNGPFESHKNGHFLMKELKLPWVNWHSPTAVVASSVFAEEGLLGHPWVTNLTPGGAWTLELDIARPAIRRWTKARLEALVSGNSDETPRRVLGSTSSSRRRRTPGPRTTPRRPLAGISSGRAGGRSEKTSPGTPRGPSRANLAP